MMWLICQSHWYLTDPPNENKYKRWISYTKQIFGVRKDQVGQPELEGLNPRENTGSVCASEVILTLASTFSPIPFSDSLCKKRAKLKAVAWTLKQSH